MSGYLLLAGGAEFGGQMALADRRALELAGGLSVPARIIPTAAAPDRESSASREQWGTLVSRSGGQRCRGIAHYRHGFRQ